MDIEYRQKLITFSTGTPFEFLVGLDAFISIRKGAWWSEDYWLESLLL